VTLARIQELLPLTDGVVTLDEHRDDDVDAYVQNPPRKGDLFWPVEPRDVAVRAWLDPGTRAQPSLFLAIRADCALVGGIELRMLTSEIGSLDYWIFPAARRCGYAIRAVALAREALRLHCGVEVVQLRVREGNLASRAIAERLGFGEADRHGDEILFYG
jgi:RimJ/RimL family protein N-acetyltransferase